nr:unnamed protein product [Callosobruchus chinensis]
MKEESVKDGYQGVLESSVLCSHSAQAVEKRAAEKVAEARKRKARRLKQAKEEAQFEIEQYRKERER